VISGKLIGREKHGILKIRFWRVHWWAIGYFKSSSVDLCGFWLWVDCVFLGLSSWRWG